MTAAIRRPLASTFGVIVGVAIITGPASCRDLAQRAPRHEVTVETVRPPVSADHTVALIITGQNSGTFEPCGCPGGLRGGLLGRATVFNRLRQEYPNVVHIDTGDQVPAFSVKQEYGYRREIRDLTDRAIIDGMRYVGYDAVLVGEQDLDWGLARFAELQAHLPLVAANLFTADGQPLARPYRLVETRAARVAVVGLVHPEAFALVEPAVREALRVTDPLAAASSIVAELEERADLIVAVTLGGPDLDTELATAVSGIDVIVSQPGHRRRAVFQARTGQLRIESPKNGLDVAVLQLNLDEKKRIAATHRRVIQINTGVPREQHLAEVFSALSFQTARLTLRGEQGLSVRSLVGPDACRDCHPVQYEYWSEHAHANALGTLLDEQRAKDPLCLHCHVTGYGLAGGYVDLFATPELAGVNCVMCHYVDTAAHGVADAPPVPEVSLDVCAMCHTRTDSPRFIDDADAYLRAATCPPDSPGVADSGAAM